MFQAPAGQRTPLNVFGQAGNATADELTVYNMRAFPIVATLRAWY